ncbi:gliding motility-associated C-terminal domain-containing protein [Arundinibacter roseus]|uniref:gliding motility-associated C-terminal domain-containing protein n=1 Tax=Arundinibacter roseus TaxID=2070510 RepID=UPI0014048353|nr:gliding motility-associated C-terminal domain-containing protein [Arundinibacter roseus]
MAQCPVSIPNLRDYGTGSYTLKRIGTTCLPATVSLEPSKSGFDFTNVIYNYTGGAIHPDSLTTDTTHTYRRPGVYTLVVFSETDGRKLIACPRVVVPDTVPPTVRLLPCGSSSVKILFDSNQPFPYDTYWVSWGDGNIEEVNPFFKAVGHTYAQSIPRRIAVWGVQRPGTCKSNETILRFEPGNQIQKPVLSELKMQDALSGELSISNPLQTELLLLRKRESGAWESTGRTLNKKNEALRVVVDSLNSVCFKVQPTDTCMLESYISEPICSAVFTLEAKEKANELAWYYSNEVSSPAVILMKDNVSVPIPQQSAGRFSDSELSCRKSHCYQLIIQTGNARFLSNPVCRQTPFSACSQAFSLFVPDAFSPNGDGINDTFEVKGEGLDNFTIQIFNGWGNVLFQSNSLSNSWNGTVQDLPVSSGYFTYKIQFTDKSSGERFTKTGAVILLK